MNDCNWANSGLKATDFVGDQPLIVISNKLSQDLNTTDGGHAANTVKFYGCDSNSGQPNLELGTQKQRFVFTSKSELNDYLNNIRKNPNSEKAFDNKLPAGAIATLEMTEAAKKPSEFDKIAGNYIVHGPAVKRTYRIVEHFVDDKENATSQKDKVILTVDGTFYKTVTKDVTGK
ncbi:hypothetical protein EFM11_05315 [Lactobacillus helveticus]|nr:hypothetical protein [Lactobacillus helveticus]MCT0164894.1 hypothetical protein [Lactobacillus helveticus]